MQQTPFSLTDQCKFEGQYYNTTLNSCQDCPIATYKEASGFTPTQCTKCADGETTKQEGSIRASDCIRMCLYDQSVLFSYPSIIRSFE